MKIRYPLWFIWKLLLESSTIFHSFDTCLLHIHYVPELWKTGLDVPDNHGGVVTCLEPDILECEVKWALGSTNTNKASGGDRIPAELFQILKDDAVKSTAPNMSTNLENSAMAMRLENISFHSNPKVTQCQRMFRLLLYNCTHFTG